MVETATFSMFHRPARAQPVPEAEGSTVVAASLAPADGPRVADQDPGPRPSAPDLVASGQVVSHSAEPAPIEPAAIEPAAIELASDPSDIAPTTEHRYNLSLPLEHQLLGLANPLVCKVSASLADTEPVALTLGRTGLYRPSGFRPAPWSGFAYDTAADHGTGLVAGTRILTARGEIPVEQLLPGDCALTLRGPALLPIIWIGRSFSGQPPIKIAVDAFGPGRPHSAVRLGADHPVFVDAHPVSARDLVNGGSICSEGRQTAEFFHVDVGSAEVLLVEGIPLGSAQR